MERACIECAKSSHDCCHLPAEEIIRSGFTVFDLARIKKHLGKQPASYATIDTLTLAEMEVAKMWRATLIFPHGLCIATDLGENACPLLTPGKGCSLPLMIRPRFCAMYPCSYDPSDNFSLYPFYWSTPDRCLAIKRAENNPEALFRELDITPQTLVKLAREYHLELTLQSRMSEAQIRSAFDRGKV